MKRAGWVNVRIMAVCMAPVLSACATYGQTEPVVFCCSDSVAPQYETVAFLGRVPGDGRSKLVVHRVSDVSGAMQQPIVDHESAVNTTTRRPLVDQDLQLDAKYDTDLSECSRNTVLQSSGWSRAGKIVTGSVGGALGGFWIGSHAGLHGAVIGSLAGLVTGGVAGYAVPEEGYQAASQHVVTQCMAERGHRATGVDNR